MSDETLKNYLLWLNERGLESYLPVEILTSVKESSQSSELKPFVGSNPKCIIVLACENSDLGQLPQDEKLLLAKLIKAIDLTFDELIILPCDSAMRPSLFKALPYLLGEHGILKFVIFGSQLISLFSQAKLGDPFSLDSQNSRGICTYSLRELLDDESRKRPTWQHLQYVRN